MSDVVLDASAVLGAALRRDRRGCRCRKHLSRAGISAVNYSECLAKMLDKYITVENGLLWLGKLKLTIHPFDAEVAATAASLRPATRGRNVSFADRALSGHGNGHGGLAVTAERGEMVEIETRRFNIECIRPEAANPEQRRRVEGHCSCSPGAERTRVAWSPTTFVGRPDKFQEGELPSMRPRLRSRGYRAVRWR